VDRKEELWKLIMFNRDASAEQLKRWCAELTSVARQGNLYPKRMKPNWSRPQHQGERRDGIGQTSFAWA